MGFGKQLKAVLNEIDMSVASLSKETGIPASTLYSIINKDIDNVGLDKVKKIEKATRAVPGNVIHNLLYGIAPEDTVISTRFHDYHAVRDEVREYFVFENYNKLTVDAQCKVAVYIEDLLKAKEYQKKE